MKRLITMLICLLAATHAKAEVGKFPLSQAAIYTDAGDFTAEWRWNVLRGYASRAITIPPGSKENTKLRIYFLDPGITLQEILIH